MVWLGSQEHIGSMLLPDRENLEDLESAPQEWANASHED